MSYVHGREVQSRHPARRPAEPPRLRPPVSRSGQRAEVPGHEGLDPGEDVVEAEDSGAHQ